MGVYLHRNNKWDAGNVGRAPTVCPTVFIALIYIRGNLEIYALRLNTLLKVAYLLSGRVDTTAHAHSPPPNAPPFPEHQPYTQKHVLYLYK